jgi:hypothetical protein
LVEYKSGIKTIEFNNRIIRAVPMSRYKITNGIISEIIIVVINAHFLAKYSPISKNKLVQNAKN